MAREGIGKMTPIRQAQSGHPPSASLQFLENNNKREDQMQKGKKTIYNNIGKKTIIYVQ